jgi:hypothetical protein
MRIAEHHFFQSCGYALAEVLPFNSGIAILDIKNYVLLMKQNRGKKHFCKCTSQE